MWLLLLVFLRYITKDSLFFILPLVRWRQTLDLLLIFSSSAWTNSAYISGALAHLTTWWPSTDLFQAANVLLVLTTLKFYTILQIWSLSAKEGEIITPLDLLAALLRLVFTGARVHCWSMNNFCPPGLLCLSCKATFLPVNPKSVLLCGVTLPLVRQCICFCWALWGYC